MKKLVIFILILLGACGNQNQEECEHYYTNKEYQLEEIPVPVMRETILSFCNDSLRLEHLNARDSISYHKSFKIIKKIYKQRSHYLFNGRRYCYKKISFRNNYLCNY